jgi:hypothetical protein
LSRRSVALLGGSVALLGRKIQLLVGGFQLSLESRYLS